MLRRSEGSLGAGRTRVGATEKAKTPERRGSRCVCFWLPTSPRVTSGVPGAGGIFGVMFEQVYNRSQDVGGRRNLSTPNFPSKARKRKKNLWPLFPAQDGQKMGVVGHAARGEFGFQERQDKRNNRSRQS